MIAAYHIKKSIVTENRTSTCTIKTKVGLDANIAALAAKKVVNTTYAKATSDDTVVIMTIQFSVYNWSLVKGVNCLFDLLITGCQWKLSIHHDNLSITTTTYPLPWQPVHHHDNLSITTTTCPSPRQPIHHHDNLSITMATYPFQCCILE